MTELYGAFIKESNNDGFVYINADRPTEKILVNHVTHDPEASHINATYTRLGQYQGTQREYALKLKKRQPEKSVLPNQRGSMRADSANKKSYNQRSNDEQISSLSALKQLRERRRR